MRILKKIIFIVLLSASIVVQSGTYAIAEERADAIALLKWLNDADPVKDAHKAIEKGDCRLRAVYGEALEVPGFDFSKGYNQELSGTYNYFRTKYGLNPIEGTSDVLFGAEHARLNKRAYEYALEYNRIILKHAPNSHIEAEKDKCDDDLSKWLKCNNPKVIKYLSSLDENSRGQILNGVLLTDGTMELRDFKFLGKTKDFGKGLHLYIFEYNKRLMAYLWIDKDGDELPLPECSKEISFESAYVLSGDVHTWKAAQPEHGVVKIMCVPDSWLRKANIPVTAPSKPHRLD